MVGELVTAGIGVGQNIKANRLQKKADALPIPGAFDPDQVAFLDQIKTRRKQIQSGTDSATTAARDLVKSNVARLSSDVFKSGAQGNVIRQLINDLSQQTGKQAGQIAASQSGATNALLGVEGSQTNVMSQRADSIKWWEKIQKMREAAELKTTANQNIGAGVQGLIGAAEGNKDEIFDFIKGLKNQK